MTAIDVTSNDTLTLAEACRLLPRGRNGSRPHLSTVLRWILSGCPAPDGRRVKLAAVRCGAKWVTSRAALQEFVDALTPRQDLEPAPPPRTPGQRRRASERAAEQLEKAGFRDK
jgi:hypothetical protein